MEDILINGKRIPPSKIITIIGLAFGLAWILIFLGLWIYQTEFQDYVIVSFQESNQIIKYVEWGFGSLAAICIIKQIKTEVNNCAE